jgi:hypothetical protein
VSFNQSPGKTDIQSKPYGVHADPQLSLQVTHSLAFFPLCFADEMERLVFLMGEVTDLHSRHKIAAPPRAKESVESDDASEVTRDLMSSGFSHDLVMDALRRHDGDANCALSWLKRKGADGVREHKAEELSGMGFIKAACIRV